jgi:glycosyltransferase involved in cell wall biosynthesis
LGHEVTLFATADSDASARLKACWPQALRLDPGHPDPMLAYAAVMERLAGMIDEFDVVHSHIDWLHIPLLRRLGVPFVTTPHGRLDVPNIGTCFGHCFAETAFVSISDAQRTPLSAAHWVGTDYHGLPEDLLVANFAPKGYLVIAFPCGSVAEVIDDGITGFVVDPTHALSAIDQLAKLDRRKVRARFEQRFTARRMAPDYIRIYEGAVQSAGLLGDQTCLCRARQTRHYPGRLG